MCNPLVTEKAESKVKHYHETAMHFTLALKAIVCAVHTSMIEMQTQAPFHANREQMLLVYSYVAVKCASMCFNQP